MPGGIKAKPFLKWAGGKGQLLTHIDGRLPPELKDGRIQRYIEPFLGGGAVFFHLAQQYTLDEIILADINRELILAYRTVQTAVPPLIACLDAIEKHYHTLTPAAQETYFYETRRRFNAARLEIDYQHFQDVWVERTAQLIFLNRTCFNGLFRVNGKGEFNVPFGRYKNPTICYADNLCAVSALLQRVQICQSSYPNIAEWVDAATFVYFDPPYRPISATASFNSYAPLAFDDAAQLALAHFYRQLDKTGARLMLSNSDPRNEDPDDDFFDQAYAGFRIERVPASRHINSRADRRGPVNELLITNYRLPT